MNCALSDFSAWGKPVGNRCRQFLEGHDVDPIQDKGSQFRVGVNTARTTRAVKAAMILRPEGAFRWVFNMSFRRRFKSAGEM
ncbi:hypothetical protein FGE21_10055 [Phaeobacter sp. B1627]|nr:hypothetical protein FGE21_10055 [Phaeobacter sp. B1627]